MDVTKTCLKARYNKMTSRRDMRCRDNKKSNDEGRIHQIEGAIFSQAPSALPIGFHFDDALRMSSEGSIFPEPAATFVGFASSR